MMEYVPTFREHRFFRLLIEGNDPSAALEQTMRDLPQRYWDCFIDAICDSTDAYAKERGKEVSGGFLDLRRRMYQRWCVWTHRPPSFRCLLRGPSRFGTTRLEPIMSEGGRQ